MALVGVELKTLVSEPDSLTTPHNNKISAKNENNSKVQITGEREIVKH